MKLKHIHIDDYKLFHDFDIDFCKGDEPLGIIVVTGVNGNGKSTLLDYIKPKQAAKNPAGKISVEVEGTDQVFEVPPRLTQWTAYQEAFRYVLYFSPGNTGKASQQLEKEILKYVDRFVYVEGKTSFEAYREIQALIDTIFANFHLQVRFKGIDADKHLVFINPNNEEFGVEGLSDGEKQLLAKVLPLFFADMKGRVVLMDEPESSLHPSWQSYLLPVLRRCVESQDCQFILTTHSPQIIAAAYKEEIRILTRREDGHVQTEHCGEGPYGWTVERVLDEIQKVPMQRVPEIENRLEELRKKIRLGQHETGEFTKEMKGLEALLGFSDPDLTLIRLEVARRKKGKKA